MTTITLRSTKGSPLTNTEVDNNFSNLNSDKAEISASTGSLETPSGTTAQRDGSPSAGFFRYNTTTGEFEGYSDDWNPLGITYTTSIPTSTTSLRLTGSNSDTDDIAFAGSGLISVTRTDASTLTFATTANNYTHPSDGADPGAALTGATVFSDITVNTAGHVTGSSTRNLTLGNLGYTGASNANNYVHPNHTGDVTSTSDGVTAIASNVVDADNLKVTGDGTTSQWLRSDGDGTFSWVAPPNDNTVYTHPTHAGDDISIDTTALSGATVISDLDLNVTTDLLGHVTDANGTIATREMTLGDLGYTGATNANNYVHPTHPGDDISIDTTALTGATIISDLDFNVTTDTAGHVTDANGTIATRELTLADLGYTGVTNANNYSHPNHSGEVTSSGDGATVVASNVIDNDNLKDSVTLVISNSAGTALKTLYGAGS